MKFDFSVTGHSVVDEIVNRSANTPEKIGHDLIKASTFEAWTGPAKTGTQLVSGIDFAFSIQDEKRSTRAGFILYTQLAIINASFFDTDIYLTYTACGDYLSVDNIRSLVSSYAPQADVILEGDEGSVDLDEIEIGTARTYIKLGTDVSKYYALNAPAGATIAGLSSLRIYGTYDRAAIKRVSSTLFLLVSDIAPGTIQEDGGSVLPPGWAWADGPTLSRSEHYVVFGRYGTAWGVGDGSTTFIGPDMREASPYGIGTRAAGVAAHDAMTIGEFKDDQMQQITGSFGPSDRGFTVSPANIPTSGAIIRKNGDAGRIDGGSAVTTVGFDFDSALSPNARTGTVTRGKSVGVNFRFKLI